MTIDWAFTNPECDVEFADIGPDEMRFIIDIWHGSDDALDPSRPDIVSIVVWRDEAGPKVNLILERDFDSVAQAKTWVEARFGPRTLTP